MAAIVRPTVSKLSERGIRELSSPVESFAPGASTTSRIHRTEWTDRFIAARAILGYSKLELNGSNQIIGLRRLTPLPHPDIQAGEDLIGPGNMWATRINSITPQAPDPAGSSVSTEDSAAKTGGSAKRATYLMADLNVQYENPGYSCLTEEDIGEGTGFSTVAITGTVDTPTNEIILTTGIAVADWLGKTLVISAGTATAATYVIIAVLSTSRVRVEKSAGTAGQTITTGEVKYEAGDWSIREFERFTRILEPQPSSEYITMPGGTLAFLKSGGGGPTGKIAQNVGKIFSTIQYKLLWKRLPFALYSLSNPTKWQKRIWGSDTNTPLIGTVNKYEWNGFKAGTLLFENCRPIPVDSMFGYLYEWDFEYTLHLDVNGWNRKYYFPPASSGAGDAGFYFVGKSTYYDTGSVPDGESIYNERDFSLLCDVRDVPPYL